MQANARNRRLWRAGCQPRLRGANVHPRPLTLRSRFSLDARRTRPRKPSSIGTDLITFHLISSELLVARTALSTALSDLYTSEGNPFLRHAEMFCSHLDSSFHPEKVEYASRLKKAGSASRKQYEGRFEMLDKIVNFADTFPAKSKRKERVEEQMVTEINSFNAQRLDVMDVLLAQMMDSEHKLGLTLQIDPMSLPLVAEAKNLVDSRRENFSPKMNMSLKHLLTNPTSIEYLKCFFRRRKMVEGLQFWLEVQKYKQLGEQPLLLEIGARFIYDLYVAEGGLRQVNLASEDADPIHTAMEHAAGINTRRGVATGFDSGSNELPLSPKSSSGHNVTFATFATAKSKPSLMSSAGSNSSTGGTKSSKLTSSTPTSASNKTNDPSVFKRRSKKAQNPTTHSFAVETPNSSAEIIDSVSDSNPSSPITSPRSGSVPLSHRSSASASSSPSATPRASVAATPAKSILSTSSSAEPSPSQPPQSSSLGPTSSIYAPKSLVLPLPQSSHYTSTLFDAAARSIATLLEDNLDGFHTSTYYRQMMLHFRTLRSYQEFVADVGGGAKGAALLLNVSGRKSSPAPLGSSALAALLTPGALTNSTSGVPSSATPTASAAAVTSDLASTGRHHNNHEGDLYGAHDQHVNSELITETIDVYRTISLPTLTVTCLCPGSVDVLGGCLDGSIIVVKLDKQGVELESAEVIPPGVIEGRILSIFRHAPSEVFILTDRGKVLLLDLNKKKAILKITKGDPFATGLLRLDSNRIWISYGKTVQDWQWNTKKKKFVAISTKELPKNVTSMVRIENSVWVGDELGGVTRLNISTLQPLGERIRVAQSSSVHLIHRSEYSTRLKNFTSNTVRVWVGCRDGALNVYDPDGNLVSRQDMSIHDLPIVGAANLERHVVLGSEDGSLTVWKPDTLELEERVGKVHKDSISAICCNSDQKLIYTAGLDRLLATWQSRLVPRQVTSKLSQIPHTAISLTKKAVRTHRPRTNTLDGQLDHFSARQTAKSLSSPVSSPLAQAALVSSAPDSYSEELSSDEAFASAVGSGSFHLADVSPLRTAPDLSSPLSASPNSYHIGSLPSPSALSGGSSPVFFGAPSSQSYNVTVDSLLQMSKHPEEAHIMFGNKNASGRPGTILPLYLPSTAPAEAEMDGDIESPRQHLHRPRLPSVTEDYPSSTENSTGTKTHYLSARSNGSIASNSSSLDAHH